MHERYECDLLDRGLPMEERGVKPVLPIIIEYLASRFELVCEH